MNEDAGSVLAQLTGQYKKGYRTSEFWVALLVGLVQTVAASFDPNQTLKAQLSNLTWVGISYILARTGLKVARVASVSRVATSVATSVSAPPSVDTSVPSGDPPPMLGEVAVPDPAGAGPSGVVKTVEGSLWAMLMRVVSGGGWRGRGSRVRLLNVHVLPNSQAGKMYRGSRWQHAVGPGTAPALTAVSDSEPGLQYFGGNTIADLVFFNFYVGGERAWDVQDIGRINWAISEAMADPGLNRVVDEYFPDPVSASSRGSLILEDSAPSAVYKDTVEGWLDTLFSRGMLTGSDFSRTAFNFILPAGVGLVDGTADAAAHTALPDSSHGLAGYHGSVHTTGTDGLDVTLYYTVAVYSQATPAGTNGIAAFDEPWKNIVATVYHELQEVRTDPDVADALRAATPDEGKRFLGWVSASGAEIGDLPLEATGGDLGRVMQEVPLANGHGTVPVQLLWSNAAHAPADAPATAPRPLDLLAANIAGEPQWPWQLARPWIVQYLAWDGATARRAVVVLPREWGPNHHPRRLPLVISPHGRNNFGWNNALTYWQNLPAQGPFALICPDGLARAHDARTDPFDTPPNPSLFTYGNRGHIDDLARMPRIIEETLPWLEIDPERVYVLGSSMGGQETLLLAARYPHALAGGYGRLAGAAAFDSPCDMAVQCGYLTHVKPDTAALMLEEVGTRPFPRRAWNEKALYHNQKTNQHPPIGQLLQQLPRKQSAWDERSPISYARQLAALPFPLQLYWSTNDIVVANQEADQSGKLYKQIKKLNPSANVQQVKGSWAHSVEFVPDDRLGHALRTFGLIR